MADQNYHSHCTYDETERSTCCALQYCTISEGLYRCSVKVLKGTLMQTLYVCVHIKILP